MSRDSEDDENSQPDDYFDQANDEDYTNMDEETLFQNLLSMTEQFPSFNFNNPNSGEPNHFSSTQFQQALPNSQQPQQSLFGMAHSTAPANLPHQNPSNKETTFANFSDNPKNFYNNDNENDTDGEHENQNLDISIEDEQSLYTKEDNMSNKAGNSNHRYSREMLIEEVNESDEEDSQINQLQAQNAVKEISDIDDYNFDTNDEGPGNQFDTKQFTREIRRIESRNEKLEENKDYKFKNRANVMLDPEALQNLVAIILPMQLGSIYGVYQKSLSQKTNIALMSLFSKKEHEILKIMIDLINKFKQYEPKIHQKYSHLNNIKKIMRGLSFMLSQKFAINKTLIKTEKDFFEFLEKNSLETENNVISPLEYNLLFKKLLDWIGINSRQVHTVNYQKFQLDKKFNIRYFDTVQSQPTKNQKNKKGGMAGAKQSTKPGQKFRLQNTGKGGASKNLVRQVTQAFQEQCDDSVNSESDVEFEPKGDKREQLRERLKKAVLKNYEDGHLSRNKASDSSDSCEDEQLNLKENCRYYKQPDKRSPGVFNSESGGVGMFGYKGNKPRINITNIADKEKSTRGYDNHFDGGVIVDEDVEEIQAKLKEYHTYLRNCKKLRTVSPEEERVYKESANWLEFLDTGSWDWVYVNSLNGDTEVDYYRSNELKTKVHDKSVMLIVALRLAEVDTEKFEIEEDDSLPIQKNHKIYVKNVSNKYLPEKWTKLPSAYYRYKISNLIKQFFNEVPMTDCTNLSKFEKQIEYKEDQLIEFLELNFRPTDYENLRNHTQYIPEGFIRANQALKVGSFPADPNYKFKEQAIYYKKDIRNLYSKFGIGLLGRKVIDGEEAKKEIITKNEKVSKLFTLEQTEPITAAYTEEGKLPVNEYGDWCLFHGLPDGAVQIEGFRIESVCKKLGIDYVPLVAKFESAESWKYVKKVKAGVMIDEKNKEIVEESCRLKEKEWHDSKNKREFEIIMGLWNNILTKLAVKYYVSKKHEF